MKILGGVLNTWLFQNPEFENFGGERFEIQSFNSCRFCCEPTVPPGFWGTRQSFTPVLSQMHSLLFHYRLSQLKDKSTKVLSLQHWDLATSRLLHRNPLASKPQLVPKSATLANQHCYKQLKAALSPYKHTKHTSVLLYTYVQVKLKSTAFSWTLKLYLAKLLLQPVLGYIRAFIKGLTT